MSAITAIGIANPRYTQDQNTAAEIVANALQLKPVEKRLLKSLYRATKIEYRHSVMSDFCKQHGEYEFFPNDLHLPFPTTAQRMKIYKEYALPLALEAIQACFDTISSFNKKNITHLITVSCTGMYAPGLDIEIIKTLQLNSNVKRTCINFMGCYAAFNAIKVADTICKADQQAKVLVVSVELCTIHFQKNDSMDNMISNAIFSDGAAAVLIEAIEKQKTKAKMTDKKCFLIEEFYCDLLPQYSQEMTWCIADNGFDIVLSSYVPQAIRSGIAAFTKKLLRQKKITLADIDFYAIHPGGHKILKMCEEALSITEYENRYSYEILRQYGNMSSATVLFVLKKIWDDLSPASENKQIFSCAFGPGLTLESVLLRVG